MSNPLLDFQDLPLFDRIAPADVAPAMDALLSRANTALDTVTAPDFPATWEAISRVLDVAIEELGRAWGDVSHLNSVADTPELRAAYNEVLPRVTEFWTRLGADERLYAKYKAIDPATLNPEQRRPGRTRCATSCSPVPSCRARPRSASPRSRSGRPNCRRSQRERPGATDAFAYYAREA